MKPIHRMLCLFAVLGVPTAASGQEVAEAVRSTMILQTSTSWNGAPLAYPEGTAEITALIIEIAPGQSTGWHEHPVPNFGLILEGTLEVSLEDGRSRQFHAGEALAEVVDVIHQGRNVGETPVRLVVFYAGVTDRPLTITPPD